MQPLLSGRAQRERENATESFIQGDVLEIGCGITSVPDRLTADDVYVGVDNERFFVEYCAQQYPERTFYLRDVDSDALALDGHEFDTVIMTAVLEHLERPAHILKEIHTVLAPDGLLVLTTPTPFGDLVHRIGSRLKLFYPESVVKHIEIFDRRALYELLETCGYEIVQYRKFLLHMNQLVVCRSKRS